MADLLARGGRLGPSSPTITEVLQVRHPAPGSTTPEPNKSHTRFTTPATLIAAALCGTEVAEIRGLPSTAFGLCPPMLQIHAFRQVRP